MKLKERVKELEVLRSQVEVRRRQISSGIAASGGTGGAQGEGEGVGGPMGAGGGVQQAYVGVWELGVLLWCWIKACTDRFLTLYP